MFYLPVGSRSTSFLSIVAYASITRFLLTILKVDTRYPSLITICYEPLIMLSTLDTGTRSFSHCSLMLLSMSVSVRHSHDLCDPVYSVAERSQSVWKWEQSWRGARKSHLFWFEVFHSWVQRSKYYRFWYWVQEKFYLIFWSR